MSLEEFDTAFERVVNAPRDAESDELGRYCRLVVDAVERGDITIEEGAYKICGTVAHVVDGLSSAEAQLLAIAGNLELPEAQRDRTLPDWNGLKALVSELYPAE